MVSVDIAVPPRSPYVGVVRLALSSLGRAAGMDEETLEDLKIAVSEACANAVLACEGSDTDHQIGVRWTEDEERFVVEVFDHISAVGATDGVDPEAPGWDRLAMSAALLESLVDECRVEPLEGGGIRTSLTLRRR